MRALCLKPLAFWFVSLINFVFPPYGGAYLALLTSVYPGYDPVRGPLGILVGTFYSLIAGALAGLLVGWLYNFLTEKI